MDWLIDRDSFIIFNIILKPPTAVLGHINLKKPPLRSTATGINIVAHVQQIIDWPQGVLLPYFLIHPTGITNRMIVWHSTYGIHALFLSIFSILQVSTTDDIKRRFVFAHLAYWDT